jgi:xylulokinase
MPTPFVIGLDVGTGGVRGVAADARGGVLATAEAPLRAPAQPRPGWREQDPADWWQATVRCVNTLARISDGTLKAICVDSTSGTIVAVDEAGAPLCNALMYNDARAVSEADELNLAGADLTARMGYRFNSSYGLARILWLARNEPSIYASARFVNAADFIAGQLGAGYCHTDYTNALKMGYDLLEDTWPHWFSDVGLDAAKLPQVHCTGEVVGEVSAAAAVATGLRPGAAIAIGPTDGVAAFYASGATRPGDAATTLGTTLVIKSISRTILLDPMGRIYGHKHARGFWLPGGASNSGCAYATKYFPEADLDALARAAAEYLPCDVLLYPLPQTGERFPFVSGHAERVLSPEPRNQAEHFAAYLQGTAFVECWAYEIVAELGGETEGTVFTSGGGSRSDLWMQLRADVLGRETARTRTPDSAFGSAVLAASASLLAGHAEAAMAMVKEERRFAPNPNMCEKYYARYCRFRELGVERGLQ